MRLLKWPKSSCFTTRSAHKDLIQFDPKAEFLGCIVRGKGLTVNPVSIFRDAQHFFASCFLLCPLIKTQNNLATVSYIDIIAREWLAHACNIIFTCLIMIIFPIRSNSLNEVKWIIDIKLFILRFVWCQKYTLFRNRWVMWPCWKKEKKH